MKIKYYWIILFLYIFLLFSCNSPEYPEDTSSVTALVYGNEKFIAGFGWAKMSISNNGISWKQIKNPFEEYTTDTMAYGNGIFVAGSVFGNIAYSGNGENWNLVENSTFGTSNINCIYFGDDKFVAVGQNGKIAYSLDGINWIKVNNSSFGNYDEIYTVIYADGIFMVGGNKLSQFNQFLGSTMAYSTDGIIWQSINYINNDYIFSATYGNDKFIVGYGNGKMAYSTDCQNWTDCNVSCFGENESIRAIAYGDSKYLAVGGGGTIAYSNNGIDWSKKNHNIKTHGFLSIVYGKNLFLVGDWNGKITIFEAYNFN